MKFRILEQGIAVTDALFPKEIDIALRIRIDAADGEVVKLVREDNASYSRIENGVATFPISELKGRISLSLVRSSGSVSLGAYVCLPSDNGVMLYHDAETILSRLAKVERDISDTLKMQRALTAKYEDIVNRIDRLFTGYNI